ncbi:monovalent cation/H(+) antiporter subunit G [Aminobacter sp. UC22_36]|uniref:monovalent cation/H(+) antiporter subunit G n=1 Tax=Aminobacter sp. UC22_36 TaxID=3374549 RepID=UPI003756DF01
MIDGVGDYLAGALIIVGALFALTASIGLLRLPDVYTRMHAASKAGTLGSCFMLIALAVHIGEFATTLRALAGVVFFLLTAPIAAHLLAKAAYSAGYRMWRGSVNDDLAETVTESKKNGPIGADR